MRPILFDTCAAIWVADGAPLRSDAEDTLMRAQASGVEIAVSPITAWEVGRLVSKGRLSLRLPPLAWFDQFSRAGVRLATLDPEILIASSFLPPSGLRDPADRILAATARQFGYR